MVNSKIVYTWDIFVKKGNKWVLEGNVYEKCLTKYISSLGASDKVKLIRHKDYETTNSDKTKSYKKIW